MNTAERTTAYRAALAGRGQPDEVDLARACDGLPEGFDPDAVWEGALLAGVPPRKLEAVAAAGDWPAVAVLADLAGDGPESTVVRYNREVWANWSPPGYLE
jgi:hypothetical protein